MYLKDLNLRRTSGDPTSPTSSAPPEPSVLADLAASLNRTRTHREVTLALRSGLRDAAAEFSFLRTCGLKALLKGLRSVARNDAASAAFRQSQSVAELQVVPVLFQNTFRQPKDDPIMNLNHIFGVEPLKISSPATTSEIALGLRVLEGCCLLHRESKNLAKQHGAVKVLVGMLSTKGKLEQGACLDALMSLMLDSPSNQMDFETCGGIENVTELIKDLKGDDTIRLKCGEFLLLLIGHVNGRESPPLENIHNDLRRILGEKCASLIWAASQFGSTLDPEQRQTALHIQARRVLESFEFS